MSADTIESTNSGIFTATPTDDPLIPADISYRWSWKVPEGAGNNPKVLFVFSDDQTPYVFNAHWFAFPDSPWWADTGVICTYSITCTATGCTPPKHASASGDWNVKVELGGYTVYGPMYSGSPTFQFNAETGEWFVADQGTFVRRTDFPVTIYTPIFSQFYDKVRAHENRHVEQFQSIAPWKDMWDVNAFYNTEVKSMTAPTREALNIKFQDHLALWDQIEQDKHDLLNCEQEWDACQPYNATAPPYLNFRREDVPGHWGCKF